MSPAENILVISQDKEFIVRLKKGFARSGYSLTVESNPRNLTQITLDDSTNLALFDLELGVDHTISLWEKAQRENLPLKIVTIADEKTIDEAVRLLRKGAFSYITKSMKIQEIIDSIKECFLHDKVQKVLHYRTTLDPESRELTGASLALRNLISQIGEIAKTPPSTSILITGESGTGKEIAARTLHKWGSQYKTPFITLNLSGLPDMLAECELFGYEKDAIPGATAFKRGALENVGQGTLYLDEIGHLSGDLQIKLFRLLREREFIRVGGFDKIPFQGRIIAASSQDPSSLVEEKILRKDLFNALSAIVINLPPLRERKEDIPLLASYFISKYAVVLGIPVPQLPEETLDTLKNYQWQGNIRQLENIIAQALIVSDKDVIKPENIPLPDYTKEVSYDSKSLRKSLQEARKLNNDVFERKFLEARLKETGGNVVEAAKIAEVSYQIFYRMMKKHGIKAEMFK